MRLFPISLVCLCACGGPAAVFSGEVSGHGLNVREALLIPLTVPSGAVESGMVVLSDQTDTCTLLAAATPPANLTLLELAFAEEGSNRELKAPTAGDYEVTIDSSRILAGQFMHTDAAGAHTISASQGAVTDGTLKVTALSFERGTLSAQFRGKFGVQGDEASISISTSRCGISMVALFGGFFGHLPAGQ